MVFWNSKAEEANQLIKKGIEISLDGKLMSQSYTGKDGQKRYSVEIHVFDFKIIEKKSTLQS
ncbi:MAG: hypothetical protein EOO99_01815 [Pedobacter sp.]|nr:MAG: hypothetical protein EOO99_01815 [Pedobacter sp.]